MSTGVRPDTELVDVQLLGFPVELHAATDEHQDELLREFAHIANADADPADPSERVPQRLLALVSDLRARYAPFSGPAREQIEMARRQGRASIDVVYRVPASTGTAAAQLSAMLDEADDFCRQGHLLTLAADAEVVAFRRWLLGEFTRQTDGGQPQPWPVASGQAGTHPFGGNTAAR